MANDACACGLACLVLTCCTTSRGQVQWSTHAVVDSHLHWCIGITKFYSFDIRMVDSILEMIDGSCVGFQSPWIPARLHQLMDGLFSSALVDGLILQLVGAF